MIVLEGFGELLEVFGGSRSGQAGSMTMKRSPEGDNPPAPAPSQLRQMPPEASRARL